ncbi:MAG: hypothetical protein AVDCRST_MAG65-2273, partial [uncultured Solirubrobacteraceae bacterium]
ARRPHRLRPRRRDHGRLSRDPRRDGRREPVSADPVGGSAAAGRLRGLPGKPHLHGHRPGGDRRLADRRAGALRRRALRRPARRRPLGAPAARHPRRPRPRGALVRPLGRLDRAVLAARAADPQRRVGSRRAHAHVGAALRGADHDRLAAVELPARRRRLSARRALGADLGTHRALVGRDAGAGGPEPGGRRGVAVAPPAGADPHGL